MRPNKFFMPYTDDERMAYARDYLKNCGYNYAKNAEEADFIILPVPTKQYMLDEMQGRLCFYAGGISESGYDYMKNEAYVLKNALLTAEGAITCLEENTPYSLINSNILIIGYGRIGQALHKLLSAYGANVTICSRSRESKSLAEYNNAQHMTFDMLKYGSNASIVLNTVPHPVLNKRELEALKPDCVIMDLASFPGGVDNHIAKSLGLTLLNGRAMPSRYTVKTAGELIGEAVADIIKEEFV